MTDNQTFGTLLVAAFVVAVVVIAWYILRR